MNNIEITRFNFVELRSKLKSIPSLILPPSSFDSLIVVTKLEVWVLPLFAVHLHIACKEIISLNTIEILYRLNKPQHNK